MLIGPDWPTATDDDGGTRLLDRPDDWVRQEVAAGLRRGIPVVPVLPLGRSKTHSQRPCQTLPRRWFSSMGTLGVCCIGGRQVPAPTGGGLAHASPSKRSAGRGAVVVRRVPVSARGDSREVITVAVRWYLRYGRSYRDVEELLAERGIDVDHVTIYRWVQRFTPLFADAARPLRHATGDQWFVDET